MGIVGEVVAPALPAVGIPILVICLWLIALGLLVAVLYLSHILTWLLSNTVGRLPGIGGAIDGIARSLEATITSTLGSAISGVDKQIAFWWHTLGDIVAWTYNEIRAHASLLETIATVMIGAGGIRLVYNSVHSVNGLVRSIAHTATAALAKATALEHALEHPERGLLGKALHTLLHPLTARLGVVERWIAGTGGTIAGEINQVIEPDIAALKQRATALENEAIRVYRDASGVWHAVNVDAIAAAISLALPALGWQWLKCSSLGSATSTRGCGLWNGLEDVLGLLVDTALLASACEIIAPLETVVSDVAVPIVDTLTGIGAGLCAGSIGVPAVLPVPRLYLPANPGISLNVA